MTLTMSEGQRIDYAPMPEVSKIKFDVGATTKSSDKHPERNEDVCLINTTQRIFGIFDGMGGTNDGKLAAETSQSIFNQGLTSIDTNHTRPSDVEEKFTTIFNWANRSVIEKQDPNVVYKMGSTATVAAIVPSETDAYQLCAIHVGDSRISIFRDGVLKRITTDHNIIEQEDPRNYDYHQNILDNFDGSQRLTPDQENFYKKRSGISRYLGDPGSRPDFYRVDLKPGDVVLFTSDGVHDNLTTNQLTALIDQNKNLDAKSLSGLIIDRTYISSHKEGNKRAKADDMSAIVVKVSGEKPTTKADSFKEVPPELPEKFKPKIGQKINVQRSSGIIQPGWEIYEAKRDGTILVRKIAGNDIGDSSVFDFKEIKYDLAERLNRQPKPEDIAKAENFGQLIFALKYIPYIQGSSERYTNESLLKLIQNIRDGLKPIDSVTRTYGLRDAVKRCLVK